MFRTTQYCELKSFCDTINVPAGTKVIPIVGGGNQISYAIADSEVLKQQNEHDRKYRYLWVPTDLVEEIK